LKNLDWKYFLIAFILLTLFSIQAPVGISVFPVFIIFILPLLTLYWLLYARVGEKRKSKSHRYVLTSLFVIIISFVFTIGIIRWQTIKSKEQGNNIIRAVENYRSIKNKYPASLDNLIPQFMYPIPYSYMGYGNVQYDYKLKPDSSNYVLSFPNAAIFSTIYNSEIREWKTE
jgi:hypothetical protein